MKNEEGTLRACVESIIDSLDELIITYQASSDATESIVKELAAAYPRKIRAYFYAPYVRDAALSNEYPQTENIHNPANYYNFGYVKISYRYYMKVDADQIYFPEKMACLRDLLRKFQPYSSCGFIFQESSFLKKAWRRLLCYVIDKMPYVSWQLAVGGGTRLPMGMVLGGINLSTRGGVNCVCR